MLGKVMHLKTENLETVNLMLQNGSDSDSDLKSKNLRIRVDSKPSRDYKKAILE